MGCVRLMHKMELFTGLSHNALSPACPSSLLEIFLFIKVIHPENNLRLMCSVLIEVFMRLKLLNMSTYFLNEQYVYIPEKKRKIIFPNTINMLHYVGF